MTGNQIAAADFEMVTDSDQSQESLPKFSPQKPLVAEDKSDEKPRANRLKKVKGVLSKRNTLDRQSLSNQETIIQLLVQNASKQESMQKMLIEVQRKQDLQ